MTAAEIEAAATDAARHALGREPTAAEVTRVLAVWCCQRRAGVSAGYLRQPPVRPVRAPKAPAPKVD